MAYAMKLPKQQGVEEGQEQIHKIRITLSSKNVKNLEKVRGVCVIFQRQQVEIKENHLARCWVAHGGKTESSGLGDVFDSHTRHLTVPHCTFLRHWERLIDLEAKEIELARDTLSIAFSPTNTMDCTLRSGDDVLLAYCSFFLIPFLLFNGWQELPLGEDGVGADGLLSCFC
ncbi:40S ribosomal protein S20-2 [Morella rubra]|uniref:40S ribosomal protein S20-2 n=1 Tax=Morella rubra TaxID=262757 RepID=A0A6A1VVY9_9ROSI|nr:40S ribosomal protein S20-2 [Morella rubra]